MEIIKEGKERFYIGENESDPLAEITFSRKEPDMLVIEHTYVSDVLKGQGIGQQLVKKVADYARQESIKVIPRCKYAQKIMTGSEEYSDLLIDR